MNEHIVNGITIAGISVNRVTVLIYLRTVVSGLFSLYLHYELFNVMMTTGIYNHRHQEINVTNSSSNKSGIAQFIWIDGDDNGSDLIKRELDLNTSNLHGAINGKGDKNMLNNDKSLFKGTDLREKIIKVERKPLKNLHANVVEHGSNDGENIKLYDFGNEQSVIDSYTKRLSTWFANHIPDISKIIYSNACYGVIHLQIDRNGTVLIADIATSTGNKILDDIMLNTAQNSGNLPTIPSDYNPESGALDFLIPIYFDSE